MKGDPVLATFGYDPTPQPLRFKVFGGLHMITGNRSPYFSLTCSGWDHGGEFGGCAHEIILKHFPQFADLAALHLSDINGRPSHGCENGFYFLGGSRRPKEICDYPAANYKHAADHFRITEAEARALVLDLFGDHYSETAGFLSRTAQAAAKARLNAWYETQWPRYQAEAQACIKAHSLVVFGDPWKVEATQ